MQCRMGLVGAQHDVRVQMSRVMIAMVQRKIALRVKDGGLVEVGVEACPDESVEALEKVGQVSWGRLGLLRLHAFQAERQTRGRRELDGSASGRCVPQVARRMCVRAKSTHVHSHHVIYALCSYNSFYIQYTPSSLMSVSITLRLWLCKGYISIQHQLFPVKIYLAQLEWHHRSVATKQPPRMRT
jgi:hypothetical protein